MSRVYNGRPLSIQEGVDYRQGWHSLVISYNEFLRQYEALNTQPLRDVREMQLLADYNAATFTPTGHAAPTTDGTLTASLQSDASYVLCTTPAGPSGATAGVYSTSIVERRYDPEWIANIRTGSSVVDARFWAGWSNADPAGIFTPTTQHVAAFRCDTTAESAVWRTVTCDGSTVTTTTTTANVSFGTAYNLRIRCNSTKNRVYFYINEVQVAEHSANLPGTSQALAYWVRVTTLHAVATKAIALSRMGMIHG